MVDMSMDILLKISILIYFFYIVSVIKGVQYCSEKYIGYCAE